MKRSNVKFVARLVIQVSVGRIIPAAITTIAPPTKSIHKVMNYVAGYAIGGMVTQKTEDYVNETIDSIYDTFAKIRGTEKTEDKPVEPAPTTD